MRIGANLPPCGGMPRRSPLTASSHTAEEEDE